MLLDDKLVAVEGDAQRSLVTPHRCVSYVGLLESI